jgi:hypothetical protein
MLNNKFLGLNGLGIKVYKTFSKLIKLLHLSFFFSNESLTSTLNQDQLILIYKFSTQSNLSNYCLLTMLNTDYKIIAKTLATHLQNVFTLLSMKTKQALLRTVSLRPISFKHLYYKTTTNHSTLLTYFST